MLLAHARSAPSPHIFACERIAIGGRRYKEGALVYCAVTDCGWVRSLVSHTLGIPIVFFLSSFLRCLPPGAFGAGARPHCHFLSSFQSTHTNNIPTLLPLSSLLSIPRSAAIDLIHYNTANMNGHGGSSTVTVLYKVANAGKEDAGLYNAFEMPRSSGLTLATVKR